MTQTRKPRKCQACGHQGGTLAVKRSADFDAITDEAGVVREAAMWLCDGSLFAVDGPVECLRRMTSR